MATSAWCADGGSRTLVFLGVAHGVLGSLLVLLVASSLPQGPRTGAGAAATRPDPSGRRRPLPIKFR